MQALLLWCALLIAGAGYGQAPEGGWYKMLQGKVGQYPVTLHLHKIGHVYAGYYYYHSRQQPIYFQGEDTTQKGRINLVVFLPGSEHYETFLFQMQNAAAMGSWKKNENAPPLNFSATEVTPSLGFDYVLATGHAAYGKGGSDGPTAHFESGGVWARGNTPAGEGMRKTVGHFLKVKLGNKEPATELLSQKEGYLKTFTQNMGRAKKEELEEMPSQFTRDETRRALVAFQNKDWVTLALYTYEFAGGAHGNYGTHFTTLNATSGKKVQLADVFTGAGMKALPQLLEAAFRRQYGLKGGQKLSESGLLVPAIKPTENFLVTGTGIGFNYVPYEIGPYAMGEILLFLPFTQLVPHLKPDFAAAVKKN